MKTKFSRCTFFATVCCSLVAACAGAGVWSNLPDTVARLELAHDDRDALKDLTTAENFLLRQASVDRLPAVTLLLEVYSSLVIFLDDGDQRVADIEHQIAGIVFERGEERWPSEPNAAAQLWAFAVRLDRESPALDRLRSMMEPPQQPEPGQLWKAAPDFSEFVYHPPVLYRHGCTVNDSLCSHDERYFRWVDVEGFWVDMYEVSNGRFRHCVGIGMCTLPEGPNVLDAPERSDEPVTGVTWYQAHEYSGWAERRLPSAAEWERVARGINVEERFPWGKRRSRERANLEGRSGHDIFAAIAPVGSFESTGYGVYDIAGNVWEWVEDQYHRNVLDAPRDGSAWTDNGFGRGLCGGSWRRSVEVARVSARSWQEPNAALDDIGFRNIIDGSQELSDREILYRADSWFPPPSGRTKEALVPGLDGSDRAYLQRRIVSGAVIEGRELEGLSIAVAILRRSSDDPVALDLLNRVRSELVENATFGRISAVKSGYMLYAEAGGTEPQSESGELEKILAELLRLEGRRLMTKNEVEAAVQCFEVSLEFDRTNAGTLQALKSTVPSAGEVRTWPVEGREMVFIPGGSFLFGASVADRKAESDEHPAYTIEIDGFWIDRFEVTNGAYRRCVSAGACTPPKEGSGYENPDLQHHPVVGVTWYQAREYSLWSGKRLPSEAEWERAARGGLAASYPWGRVYEPGRANGFGVVDRWSESSPVGSFPQHQLGHYDMLGNAWEWVADVYHRDFLDSPKSGVAWTQVNGGLSTEKRVLRGGSFNSPPDDLRVSRRESRAPGKTNQSIGFRCAVSR